MNTFWLKLAGIAVGAVVVIILVGMFTGGDEQPPQPPEPEKGFYDQVERDKQKFLTMPQPVKPEDQDPPSQPETPAPNQLVTEPVQPVQPPQPVQSAVADQKPVTLYFKELSEIDEIEASRYYHAAAPARTMGRLQIGFKNMVDNCRRIIQRWPDSMYAYKAQQLIIDMPERFYSRYKVTEAEKDLSRFTKPRPGTKPFTDDIDKD